MSFDYDGGYWEALGEPAEPRRTCGCDQDPIECNHEAAAAYWKERWENLQDSFAALCEHAEKNFGPDAIVPIAAIRQVLKMGNSPALARYLRNTE